MFIQLSFGHIIRSLHVTFLSTAMFSNTPSGGSWLISSYVIIIQLWKLCIVSTALPLWCTNVLFVQKILFQGYSYFYFLAPSAAGQPSPVEHLCEVFCRMGLNDKVCTECCVWIKHARILNLLLTIILYSVGNCCTVRSSYTWTGKTRA